MNILLIFVSILRYVIIYEKGYQEFEKPYSSVTTKVKGLSLTNLTNSSNPLALYGGVHVWDSSDFVIPPEVKIVVIINVSMTKFSIVIGSQRAYLSCNRRAITWVSNYRSPIWTFCNWIPVIESTHMIFMSITCALMASLPMFPTVFNTYEKSYQRFCPPKNFSKDIFNSEICYSYD